LVSTDWSKKNRRKKNYREKYDILQEKNYEIIDGKLFLFEFKFNWWFKFLVFLAV